MLHIILSALFPVLLWPSPYRTDHPSSAQRVDHYADSAPIDWGMCSSGCLCV